MKSDIDIDELMAETWLTVAMLKHAAVIPDGQALYRSCLAQVEKVQQALKASHVDEESIGHISYAQCALLDEIVLSRKPGEGGSADDTAGAQREWRAVPLQAHFFGSLRAGEAIWDRIAEVLRQPAPLMAVLTCYHRVLSLGFQGMFGAGSVNTSQREEALKALVERVPPLDPAVSLVVHKRRLRHFSLFRSAWFWALLALSVTLLAWCGGHLWLQALLAAQLPELRN